MKYFTKRETITLSDGSKHQIKTYGKTEAEAIIKLERRKWEYEHGMVVVSENTPYNRWFVQWLDTYKRPALRQSSIKNIIIANRNYFEPVLKNTPLAAVKTLHIQQCMNLLQGKSQSYIKKNFAIINSIFQTAADNDLIKKNPCRSVKLPNGNPKQTRRSLTAEEQSLFWQTVDNHPKGSMFAVTLACGLRPGEVRALQWRHINLKNGVISVMQAVEKGTNNLKPPKSASGIRTVPIPDRLLSRLRKLPRNIDDNAFVFGENSRPMTEQRYKRAWKSFLNQMDVANGAQTYRNAIIEQTIDHSITPYHLRHTYCTNLCKQGVDLKTAQYLMGHAGIELTAEIYTHVDNDMIETAREKINTAVI